MREKNSMQALPNVGNPKPEVSEDLKGSRPSTMSCAARVAPNHAVATDSTSRVGEKRHCIPLTIVLQHSCAAVCC